MKKGKIDETAGRMGTAMRSARQVCHIALDEAASFLDITPAELFEYERGSAEVPFGVLEHVFTMGYKMLHIRILENKYLRQRNLFRKAQRMTE